MSTNNTNCIIEGKKVHQNGFVQLSMRMLKSSRPHLTTNELPNILHSIKVSGMLDDSTSHTGFDYTLDFPMVEHNMFPYVLNFEMR